MLMVAWRDIISGDRGFSVEKSIVLGSGCSLLTLALQWLWCGLGILTEAVGALPAAALLLASSAPTLALAPRSPPARTRSRRRGDRGLIPTP
jgi:hypothetical protein